MKNVNQFEITGRLTGMKINYPTDLYIKIKVQDGTTDDNSDEGQMDEDSIHMNLEEAGLVIDEKKWTERIKGLIGKYVQIKGYLDIKKEAPNSVELEATSISEFKNKEKYFGK